MSTGAARVVGRYVLHEPIAAGGMATVHLGRLVGPVGFTKTVAIKRLREDLAGETGGIARFLDEARLTARVQHPNVVSTLDALAVDGELFLIMEYVKGAPLSLLFRNEAKRDGRVPVDVAVAAVIGALHGLHAAHEARDDSGELLGIIHRDVSPQNIMLGVEGVPRLLDFGVAKATFRLQSTEQGALKGKLAYMAPEQLAALPTDRRVDIHAMGIVFWELLTGQRLFQTEDAGSTIREVMEKIPAAPSSIAPEVPKSLDEVLQKALSKRPQDRFATAHDFAVAIEQVCQAASQRAVGEYVRENAAEHLKHQEALLARAVKGPLDEAVTGVERGSMPSLSGNEAPTELHTPSARAAHLPMLAGDSGRSATGVAASMRAPTPAKRPRLLALALVLAGALIALAIFLRPSSDAAAPSKATPLPLPPAALTPAKKDEPTPAPVTPPTPAPAAPDADPPDAAPRGRTPRAGPRPTGKPSCNPPYVIDERGIKRYLPECF